MGFTEIHAKYACLVASRIDRVQLRLQNPRMSFGEALHDVVSLATELSEI